MKRERKIGDSLVKVTITCCVPDARRVCRNVRTMCITHIVNITEDRIKLNITTAFQCSFTNFSENY
jgi:hypothetical protein